MLFKTIEDKATFYINNYTSTILNAVKKDINKVAKATGNKESPKSVKLQIQAALWIAVCENPKASVTKILKIAKKDFNGVFKNEYEEERVRARIKEGPSHGRKDHTVNYTAMPWGVSTKGNQLISQMEAPDAFIEREEEMAQIVKITDILIRNWGPQATLWALAKFKSTSIYDAARLLGFEENELKTPKVRNRFRKIYRMLNDIKSELELQS